MKKKFINRRKKNFIFLNKFYLLFLVIIIALILFSLNFQKIINFSKKYIENYSLKNEYVLKTIEISNLNYLDKSEILHYLNSYKDKSIFLIPLNDISKDIKRNKWIKTIKISSNYINTLKIYIEEVEPFGIYENNNQKILFSSDLIFLEIIRYKQDYPELITFFGEDSIINSKKLLNKFDKEFYDMIESVFYIEKRRWDILLKNKILLRFPENKIQNAIMNYKKIYANFSNKDLKVIKSIDLRISDQAIIKYQENND